MLRSLALTHNYPGGTFQVTLFEKSDRIGGLWPTKAPSGDDPDDGGLLNPNMCTNQSRHTVSFSSLAWPEASPQIPKAWQVGQYLERYVQTYPGYDIRLKSKVLSALPPASEGERWKISVNVNSVGQAETHHFDHLIVASGFFGSPVPLTALGDLSPFPIRHSSKFRDLYHLLTENGTKPISKGRKIVVVGGQMSGVEVAASIALQLSSAINSPADSRFSKLIPNAGDYSIVHVIQKPFWTMPLTFPKTPVAGEEKVNYCLFSKFLSVLTHIMM